MRPARAAGRVHPDDFRAQVAKHHRGKRARDVVAEIHHKQPVKCSRHGRLLGEELRTSEISDTRTGTIVSGILKYVKLSRARRPARYELVTTLTFYKHRLQVSS